MKKLLTSILILSIVMVSCKKEDKVCPEKKVIEYDTIHSVTGYTVYVTQHDTIHDTLYGTMSILQEWKMYKWVQQIGINNPTVSNYTNVKYTFGATQIIQNINSVLYIYPISYGTNTCTIDYGGGNIYVYSLAFDIGKQEYRMQRVNGNVVDTYYLKQ